MLPAIALASAAGYYLGSVVGLELRVPPATTSVMWPPNAVQQYVRVKVRKKKRRIACWSQRKGCFERYKDQHHKGGYRE